MSNNSTITYTTTSQEDLKHMATVQNTIEKIYCLKALMETAIIEPGGMPFDEPRYINAFSEQQIEMLTRKLIKLINEI